MKPPSASQNPGKGKCSTGYLWVIHAPRNGIKGDILYQWHPSRKATCLDDLLRGYQGYLQTDAYAAYAAYDSWIADKADLITLRARPEVLPKSALGKAIDYTLTLWEKLTLYVDQGQLEIDNNWTRKRHPPHRHRQKKIGSSSAAKPPASAAPSFTRSSSAPAATATTPKPTSPTSSSVSPP